MNVKGNRKSKKRRTAWRTVGGVVFVAGMCIIAPKLIEKGADYFYHKNRSPVKPWSDDDWGPEIVKKSTLEGTKDGKI